LRDCAAGLSEIVLYIVATSSAEGEAAIASAREQAHAQAAGIQASAPIRAGR